MFKKIIQILFMLFFNISILYANVAYVPLENIRLPADDLVYDDFIKRNPEEAFSLQNDKYNPLDLSLLDPYPNEEIWENRILKTLDPALDNLSIENGDTLVYAGDIGSAEGTFRFNVIRFDPSGKSRYYTIMFSKTLHMTLLRKNLLRKLGYEMPPMKWIKNLNIHFESLEAKNNFLNKEIPVNTSGSYKRWVVSGANDNSLTIEIRDMIVTVPLLTNHLVLAMGAPTGYLGSRILRSLLIPFSLIGNEESINQLSWTVGRINNKQIELPHFTESTFNATIDDCKWILRRLYELHRKDWEEIVKLAFFPKPVQKLLVEKLISRQKSLFELYELTPPNIRFNPRISYAKELVNGKIVQKNWPEFASRFTYEDQISPIANIENYIFLKFQNNLIQNLINEANKDLSLIDINKARQKYFKKEFTDGLKHYIKTGEFLEQKVGTWFSPTIDGKIIISRDTIVGSYLGADNLVQLADTIGASVRIGGHLGFEGFDTSYGLFSKQGVSYLKTYTHLKPIDSLKETVKEPYRNIIVPLLKNNLIKDLSKWADFQKNNNELFSKINKTKNKDELSTLEKERDDKLSEILIHINKNLGIGESIIITDLLRADALIQGGYMTMALTKYALGIGSDGIELGRVHIFRKNSSEIQIFVDNGKSASLFLNASVSNEFIPIIKVQAKRAAGNYSVDLYKMNINTDIEKNPYLFKSANAMREILKTGSTELLEDITPPHKIKGDFLDKSFKMRLLLFVNKNLNKTTRFDVEFSEGYKSSLFKIEKSGVQGINFIPAVSDIINYLADKYYPEHDINVSLDDEWRNPGHTLGGFSVVKRGVFESKINPTSSWAKLFDKYNEISTDPTLLREKILSLISSEKDEALLSNISDIDEFINEAENLAKYKFSQFESLMSWQNRGRNISSDEIERRKSIKLLIRAWKENGLSLANVPEAESMVTEPFIQLSKTHEGWSADVATMKRIISEIENEYGYKMFPDNVFGEIKRFDLYNISANLNIYERGIENIINLSVDEILKLEEKYNNPYSRNDNPQEDVLFDIKRYHSKCLAIINENERDEKLADCVLDLTRALERKLEFNDFLNIVGKDNIYVYALINGYRKNTEYLSKTIESNTLGEIGSFNFNGPVDKAMKLIGIGKGEFEAGWLREVE